MKKILFLLLAISMTNIQGIMAQEKITQTVGRMQLGEFAPTRTFRGHAGNKKK